MRIHSAITRDPIPAGNRFEQCKCGGCSRPILIKLGNRWVLTMGNVHFTEKRSWFVSCLSPPPLILVSFPIGEHQFLFSSSLLNQRWNLNGLNGSMRFLTRSIRIRRLKLIQLFGTDSIQSYRILIRSFIDSDDIDISVTTIRPCMK